MSANLYARTISVTLCLLHRAQATGANRNGLGIATDGNLYLADVGLPTSLRFTVGVGNVFAEYNALTADTALSHFDTSKNPALASVILYKFI